GVDQAVDEATEPQAEGQVVTHRPRGTDGVEGAHANPSPTGRPVPPPHESGAHPPAVTSRGRWDPGARRPRMARRSTNEPSAEVGAEEVDGRAPGPLGRR